MKQSPMHFCNESKSAFLQHSKKKKKKKKGKFYFFLEPKNNLDTGQNTSSGLR